MITGRQALLPDTGKANFYATPCPSSRRERYNQKQKSLSINRQQRQLNAVDCGQFTTPQRKKSRSDLNSIIFELIKQESQTQSVRTQRELRRELIEFTLDSSTNSQLQGASDKVKKQRMLETGKLFACVAHAKKTRSPRAIKCQKKLRPLALSQHVPANPYNQKNSIEYGNPYDFEEQNIKLILRENEQQLSLDKISKSTQIQQAQDVLLRQQQIQKDQAIQKFYSRFVSKKRVSLTRDEQIKNELSVGFLTRRNSGQFFSEISYQSSDNSKNSIQKYSFQNSTEKQLQPIGLFPNFSLRQDHSIDSPRISSQQIPCSNKYWDQFSRQQSIQAQNLTVFMEQLAEQYTKIRYPWERNRLFLSFPTLKQQVQEGAAEIERLRRETQHLHQFDIGNLC